MAHTVKSVTRKMNGHGVADRPGGAETDRPASLPLDFGVVRQPKPAGAKRFVWHRDKPKPGEDWKRRRLPRACW